MVFSDNWGHRLVEREFEEAGLPCCTAVNDVLGFRTGYAAVPEGHPLFGKDRGAAHAAVEGLSANGDLTWEGPVGPFWAFGWDAGHLWNAPDPGLLSPRMRARREEAPWEFGGGEPDAVVVGADEAERITRSLARQLASAGGGAVGRG